MARARSTQHRLGPARLDISQGQINSTMAWARSAWHQPGALGSTLDRAQSTQHRSRPAPLDIGLCPRETRHWLGPAQLDIDPVSDEWINIRPGPRRLNIRHGPKRLNIRPRPRWLNIRPGPIRLDIGPGLLGSTLARAQLNRHRFGPAPLDIGPNPNDLT